MRTIPAAVSAALVSLAVGAAEPARAALFAISGTADQPLSGAVNDLIPTPSASFQSLVPGGGIIRDPDSSPLFSNAGARLLTTADQVAITYNYIGSFAEATNVFSAGGLMFENAGLGERGGGDFASRPPIQVVQAAAGPLDFAFATSLDGGSSVTNLSGRNAVGGGLVNYLMAYLEPHGRDGDWKLTDDATNVVLILFDDAGRGPDGNDYDDLGVIAIAAPIPASLPLFAAALCGLGLMMLRRKGPGGAPGTPAE